MKAHPATELFPMMSEPELADLAADIRRDGLHVPITLYKGMILDGRNRIKACAMAGVEPRFEEWRNHGSPTAWVISMNLHRRHLTAGQRAMMAASPDVLVLLEAEARGRQIALAGSRPNAAPDLPEIFPEGAESREQAAQLFGVNPHYVSDAKQLREEAPALAEQVLAGSLTLPEAKTQAKRAKREQAKQAIPPDLPRATDRYRLIHSDIRTVDLPAESVDCIITDPPYPEEYLDLYADLARLAAHVLKPQGSLVAMVGQAHLPEVLSLMVPHIRYHWILACLMPGGGSMMYQRKVSVGWKPVLWFTKSVYQGDAVHDVVKSDAQDKRFHDWGQSESGMANLVERFTYPGQTILDPFLGGGTTGVVAVRMNRLFIGVDNDQTAVATAAKRLAEEG